MSRRAATGVRGHRRDPQRQGVAGRLGGSGDGFARAAAAGPGGDLLAASPASRTWPVNPRPPQRPVPFDGRGTRRNTCATLEDLVVGNGSAAELQGKQRELHRDDRARGLGNRDGGRDKRRDGAGNPRRGGRAVLDHRGSAVGTGSTAGWRSPDGELTRPWGGSGRPHRPPCQARPRGPPPPKLCVRLDTDGRGSARRASGIRRALIR